MRLADLSVDDSTRQAIPVAEAIANGAANTPMILPSAATNAGTSVGSPNSVTNGVLMDDDDDEFLQAETSPFDINDAFDEHTSNFRGKKPKPRKPGTSIAKLPVAKAKPAVSSPVEVFLDNNGDEYEYLGQFDGNTDFLDEKYKGAVAKPGDHLYRKQIGAQFDGQAQFEYFIGDDPQTSAVFGKIFKGIGKAFKKVGKGIGKAGKYWWKNAKAVQKRHLKIGGKIVGAMVPGAGTAIGGAAEKLSDAIPNGNSRNDLSNAEYVGQSNGDLSFLTEIEPGVTVKPGDHIYRVQRTESFDGDSAEFDYYIGGHPDYSNGIGSFFKKIGKGIGKAAKAVGKGIGKAVKATGKGIGNAAKWTVNKAIPVLTGAQAATPEESNGVIPTYNPVAGMEQLQAGGYPTDFGDGLMYENTGSSIDSSNLAAAPIVVAQSSDKTLQYVLIAAVILAVIIYLKNNK